MATSRRGSTGGTRPSDCRGAKPFSAPPPGFLTSRPQVQLLFKSRHLRPKDDRDAGEVIPALDDGAREWLAGRLPAEHPWRAQVGAGWDASR